MSSSTAVPSVAHTCSFLAYKCPIPSCTKSFAVRSNAKRHLRTHGIFPTSEHSAAPTQFTVGFDAPIVSEVHEVGKLPAKLRWVPQSLATRTNVDFLRDAPSDSEDEYPPSCPVLSVPLPAVVPSSPKWNEEDFEDRNSYEDMGPSPYLNAHQVRSLPPLPSEQSLTLSPFVVESTPWACHCQPSLALNETL